MSTAKVYGWTGPIRSDNGEEPPQPPGPPTMEPRIAKLEAIAETTSERLTVIERDVAVIKSNYATKADVAEAKNSVIMWVVSAILLAQLLPAILKKFGL